MTDVLLATSRDQTAYADDEGPVVVDLLRQRGLSADMRPWGNDTDWSSASLVILRSTWDYTERLADFLSWVREVERTTRIVNSRAVVEWNSHKGYLRELRDSGVPIVPTTFLARGASGEAIEEALATYGSRSVVAKPAVGAGARGALLAPAAAAETAEHVRDLSRGVDVLVQPYVESVAAGGELSLLFFQGDFSHAVRKLPGEGDFRVQQHLGGSTRAHRASTAEREVAARALESAPQAVAYARVDLVYFDSVPVVMELELIEPYLFLEYLAGSVDTYVDAIIQELP